jgi:hypothetical protein
MHKLLFNHRSTKNFKRFHPDLRTDALPSWMPFKIDIRNSKKIKKIKKLRIASCYVTLLQGKITNLEYYYFLKKVFSKQSYHVWRSWHSLFNHGTLPMLSQTFKRNYQCYSHNHGIVYSNDHILCKCVRLRMTNNVPEGSFYFFCTKNLFFIFWVTQIGVFVKELPKFNFKIGPKQSQKILEHLGFKIQHLVGQKIIYRYFLIFWQLSADSVGSGPNLNYKCFIVCSWFFSKNIFRCISWYFIRDLQKVSQDSTHIYKRATMYEDSWVLS